MPPLKVAEASGKAFLDKGSAPTTSRPRVRGRCRGAAKGPGAGTAGGQGFWPVFDGNVLPGDQYKLYQAGRFNDTNVLIGTNSDEGSSVRDAHGDPRCV